jgi:hypothetical protein
VDMVGVTDTSSSNEGEYGDDYEDDGITIKEDDASIVSEVTSPPKWARLEDFGETNARMEL